METGGAKIKLYSHQNAYTCTVYTEPLTTALPPDLGKVVDSLIN